MATPPSLFCDYCGAANQSQAMYCRACGKPLQGAKPTIYNSATGRLLTSVELKQRYRIIAPTGKGGMGAVYKAEDTQLGNRLVAIKEMSQSGMSQQEVKEAAEAFKQEAIILARLQHPNLPSIFDHFEENGRWYLVMSFIQGETLEEYLNRTKAGKLPLDEALQIGLELSTVLDFLHNQQPAIIFRDLKPANIMRTPSGDIYLIDFGIARHFKPGQAKDTAYFGSMGYAPPEQYGKAQTTPRSDIYSLGATLYQLVSGHDPASTPFRFPPLLSIEPTAPGDLATLLKQMLDTDEDQRPADMRFVKKRLQTIASPVASPPPPKIAPTVVVSQTPQIAPTVVASNSSTAHSVSASVGSNPKPSNSIALTQPIAKPIKVWEFGRNQLMLALVCTICYGLVACLLASYASNNFFLQQIVIGLLFVFPIFFGAVFGPWVATIAAGIGIFSVYYLQIHGFIYRIWLRSPLLVVITLSGFFAGLILFKTKGQYNTFGNIVFTTLIGLVDICIGVALLFLIFASIFNEYYIPFNYRFYFPNIIILILPCLILLPLLLLSYNAITRRIRQNHP